MNILTNNFLSIYHSGPFVSAIGKTWHPDHFCCSSCNTSLQNQAFVEENNQLYCEKCYNSFYAPKCAHCNNAIIGVSFVILFLFLTHSLIIWLSLLLMFFCPYTKHISLSQTLKKLNFSTSSLLKLFNNEFFSILHTSRYLKHSKSQTAGWVELFSHRHYLEVKKSL